MGKQISHDHALQKARLEYGKYHSELVNATSDVERHFILLEKIDKPGSRNSSVIDKDKSE